MKRIILIYALTLICPIYTISQNADNRYITTLNELFKRIIDTNSDTARISLNDSVYNVMDRLIADDQSSSLPFDSVKYIGKVLASDGNITLYSWMIPLKESTIYNALFLNRNGDKSYLTRISSSEQIDEKKTYTPETWYGALYYSVIPFKVDKHTYYTLLGWRNRQVTRQKVIDIIRFDGSEPTLGLPVFEYKSIDYYNTGKEIEDTKSRIVFDFDRRVSMYLEYNASKKRIECDNLSPMEVVDGKILSYGPDFSINAYRMKKGKWIFTEDIKVKGKRRK